MAHELKTLCPYCGVGCGLLAKTDGSRRHQGPRRPAPPGQLRQALRKGATVAQTVDVANRLRHAMVRPARGEAPLAVPAGKAIARVADGLNSILQSHGPQAIAFYLSGQLTTEAQYLFNKFAKGCLRTNHVDSNSRLCMSSAASGMTLSLGSDGPPTCYEDIELADAFFFIGSNAADCHPVTFGRVQRRVERGRAECIVVDPRRTATAAAATLHLPIRPGTDLALLNGLLHLLHRWNRLDRAFISGHTEGWAELEAMLPDYPPERVGAGVRHPGVRPRPRGPDHRSRTVADHVLDDGGEPEHDRDVREQRDHQPPPGARADRPARVRPVQPDRPAQRDGRPRRRAT